MMKTFDKLKPAVDKNILILLSFLMWVAVGIMLLIYAYSWVITSHIHNSFIYIGIGVAAALVIHHFGFLHLVDKNLGRILPMEGQKCLFAFMTWKSYLIVIVMVIMGTVLRHSSIPKSYLSVVYIGIGLSLLLSSIRYLRFFIINIRTP